jgi:hypothetical protein
MSQVQAATTVQRTIPIKPSELKLWLYRASSLRSLEMSAQPESMPKLVAYDWAGARQVMTVEEARELLDFCWTFDGFARLKPFYREQVSAWIDWEKRHAADFAEFRRLGAKLGLPTP